VVRIVRTLVRDGWAAALALVAILTVTGPVRTLDVANTPIAWAGSTAWGLIVFWGVRHLHDRRLRTVVVLAGVAVGIVGMVVVLGPGPSRAASLLGIRVGTGILVAAALVLVAAAAVALSTRTSIRSPGMSFLVLAVVALFILFDLGVVKRGDALRDLRLYLAAGQRFAEGMEPYQLSVIPSLLPDQSAYPFLYPPVSLPLFGALAALPYPVTSVIWTVTGVAGGFYALHLLGARGTWLFALALWPPFFEGLWAGNVAVPATVLLAAGFTSGRFLVLGPLLKVQGAIPPLWLLRERRWRELAIGLAIVLGICLLTLPLVGLQAWYHWIAGLRAFQETQRHLPVLYAFALPRVVPYAVFLAVAAAAVGWAILRRGTPGLARLGLASVVASPSLYRHGLLGGLPAILALDPQLVWLVLGLPLTYWGIWIGVIVTALASTIGRSESPPLVDGHPAPSTPARAQVLADANARGR
jgi:hypothetical protein